MNDKVNSVRHTSRIAALYAIAAFLVTTAIPAFADTDAAASAKDAQNPVASMVSLPFQNDTYYDTGPYNKTENALIVEPVKPFKLSDNWNLISRWITPLIYQPQISPYHGSTFGLGNLEPQFYLSPAHPGNIIWGFGPQVWLPTATDKTIGVNKLGGGPAMVALTIQGPWLVGLLANQTWAGSVDHNKNLPANTFPGNHVNQAVVNPFVFYNMPGGWYVMSSPVATAQWDARGSDIWTVPVGGGFGRVFKIGRQIVNARFQVFNNVHRPAYDPTWETQLQVQLLFPVKHQ
jgi:hypothetical protein